jgi:hypothetical protein
LASPVFYERKMCASHRQSVQPLSCTLSPTIYLANGSLITSEVASQPFRCAQTRALTHRHSHALTHSLTHPSIHPSVRPSIDQSIHQSIDPSIHPFIGRSIDRSFHQPPILPSIHEFSPSIYPEVSISSPYDTNCSN